MPRHRRIVRALAAKIPTNVAAVLAEQGRWPVFGVTLQKEEKALFLLMHEGIDAGLTRAGEHLISASAQCRFVECVPAGVRRCRSRREIGDQGMFAAHLAIEHANALLGKRNPLY